MGDLAEEISIFQNKHAGQPPATPRDAKGELSLKKENPEVKELKQEIMILKKEIATLKDSNENHIFINEKLNKALKKKEE